MGAAEVLLTVHQAIEALVRLEEGPQQLPYSLVICWRRGQRVRLRAEASRLTRHIQHSKDNVCLMRLADLLAHLTPSFLILIRQRETAAQ